MLQKIIVELYKVEGRWREICMVFVQLTFFPVIVLLEGAQMRLT
jgi:hypothetical protein